MKKQVLSKCILGVALTLLTVSLAPAATLIEDKFDFPQKPGRDLASNRGEWKLEKGIATCTQDDELYKKNKDHGPVMWYSTSFKDATVRFAYKAEKTKQFVFTLNDDKGHVFRFVHGGSGLSVRAWPEQGKEAKATSLIPREVKTPPLPEGKWVEAVLKFEGNKCELAVGDFKKTFEHAAIGKEKTKLGLGFSFGTVSVRDVKVETLAKTALLK